jgi:hypothetical protein
VPKPHRTSVPQSKMKVEEKGHTIIIKDTHGDSNKFLEKLTAEYNSFKNKNLVLGMQNFL